MVKLLMVLDLGMLILTNMKQFGRIALAIL